eukprot:GEMP01036681.1.p1 GENE.GEMP01036681.1~~GEMP01036681.1.p1  ORF type:complete len:432 (+),score=109.81 GEMP01036681.1:46-1296(+)
MNRVRFNGGITVATTVGMAGKTSSKLEYTVQTKRAVKAGQILFEEDPVVIVLNEMAEEWTELSRKVDIPKEFLAGWVVATKTGVIDEMLERFRCDIKSPIACRITKLAHVHRVKLVKALPYFEEDSFVRFCTAMEQNHAVSEVYEAGEEFTRSRVSGVGLWVISALLSHSCSYNSHCFTDARGAKIVRAVVDIAEGEELTISFLSDDNLILPVEIRRQKIHELYNFWCSCPRCAGIDQSRRFPCPHCDDVVFALGSRFTACDKCGVLAEDVQKRYLDEELAAIKEIEELRQEVQQNDCVSLQIAETLARLPLHAHHYLSVLKYSLLFAIYARNDMYKQAAQCAVYVGECFAEHSKQPGSPGCAWKYEVAGNFLQQARMMNQAKQAWTRALERLAVAFGTTHTCYRLVEARLRALQQ